MGSPRDRIRNADGPPETRDGKKDESTLSN